MLGYGARIRAARARNTDRAPLVQLDRMSAYGADGRRFESCTGCFYFARALHTAAAVIQPGGRCIVSSARPHGSVPSKSTPDGTRTRNLRLRRATPYPLGHRSFKQIQSSKLQMSEVGRRQRNKFDRQQKTQYSQRGLNPRSPAHKTGALTTKL